MSERGERAGAARSRSAVVVWMIGGASGSGKSRVAYRLATSLGVPIVEVDDIFEALVAMSLPEQQPVLHFWRTHPEAERMAPAAIVELQVAVADAVLPALEAVVANHLETDMPVVIEGDYLVPAFAARPRFANQGRRPGASGLPG